MSKIEFNFSIKEFTFSFKGDRETAERVSGSINKAMEGLRDTQTQVLGLNPKANENVIDVTPEPDSKRRRRRTAKSSTEGDGSGCAALVKTLREGNYFAEPRRLGDIKERLKEMGHTFNNGVLGPTLMRLTQANVLSRTQQNNQWVYTAGAGANGAST